MLDDRQIAILLKRFYDFELEEENRLRLSGVQFDEANRKAAISYFERLGVDVRLALARNELERADNWVAALLEREGITPELDPDVRAKLQQGILRASCDVAEAMKKRFEGDFNYLPQEPLLSVVGLGAEMPAIDVLPGNVIGEGAPVAPLFSVVAKDYREKRLRLKSWDGQTASRRSGPPENIIGSRSEK